MVIPEKYRQKVLEDLHASHPGIVRIKSLARRHVWMPGLNSDIYTNLSQYVHVPCRSQLPDLHTATANP